MNHGALPAPGRERGLPDRPYRDGMASGPAFRLFGFPVHVRTGFLVFLATVMAINGVETGAWFALFLTVLLLVHELGHALAARATGARAEITLDFLAGYASFAPTHPLAWWQNAGISLAGPLAQFAVGVGALVAWGVNPADLDHAGWSIPQQTLWFAGPVIALLNLLPVLPLDGGHVVEAVLTRVAGPTRGPRLTLYSSIALTVVGYAVLTLATDVRISPIFVVLPLLFQLQMLGSERARGERDRHQQSMLTVSSAEAEAWRSGALDGFGPGAQPSPWYLASLHRRSGHLDLARQVIEADLRRPSNAVWWPPPPQASAEVGALVDLLERPYPSGNERSELVLASILHQLGRYEDAARYAASCYESHRQPALALLVARAAAALGDRSTATAWLRTALDSQEGAAIRAAAASTPELAGYLNDPLLSR